MIQKNFRDEQLLKYLKGIDYKKHSENSFELTFHFDENEFMTNKFLKKLFYLDQITHKPMKSESPIIEWKEGKNLTKKTIKQVRSFTNLKDSKK
jgi:hypothetical protein